MKSHVMHLLFMFLKFQHCLFVSVHLRSESSLTTQEWLQTASSIRWTLSVRLRWRRAVKLKEKKLVKEVVAVSCGPQQVQVRNTQVCWCFFLVKDANFELFWWRTLTKVVWLWLKGCQNWGKILIVKNKWWRHGKRKTV